MIKYKIFIIFHAEIDASYYHESILEHLVFVNVNPSNTYKNEKLLIINLDVLENFMPLGKWYAESEVLYNVYVNHYLTDDIDYIGFAHYDIDLIPITENFIEKHLSKVDLINFQPYTLKQDYRQKILMDKQYPNQLTGNGRNCYLGIFEDYNKHYSSNYDISNYLANATVNLCACFIVKKTIFNDMMLFINQVIEDDRLAIYDTNHKYRIQGGLLERYYAVWFLLHDLKCFNIHLAHNFIETQKQHSLLRRFKIRLVRLFKIFNSFK